MSNKIKKVDVAVRTPKGPRRLYTVGVVKGTEQPACDRTRATTARMLRELDRLLRSG